MSDTTKIEGPYQLRKVLEERGPDAPVEKSSTTGTKVRPKRAEKGITLTTNGEVKQRAKPDTRARDAAMTALSEQTLEQLSIAELQALIPEGADIKKGLRKSDLVKALKSLGIGVE